MNVGNVLSYWRAERRMGIRDAARIIGISPATLSRIENGRPVDGKTLVKLMIWLFSK